MEKSNYVIIENERFCLKLSESCIAESLVYKPDGTECLADGCEMPFFSLTEDRPYNNEIKLAYPNKRTTFGANRVRREGNRLIVGFELISFEAVIEITEAPRYIAFSLVDFRNNSDDFGIGVIPMTILPVAEFRLIQLPLLNRERYGQWLNVLWDKKIAVNVLATSPYARIDSQIRKECRIMTADAVRGIKLNGTSAAIIVSASDEFLDAVEDIENDYCLPKGVKSRRSKYINASAYWSDNVCPENVDEHIAYAKKGGFSMMLLYYSAVFKEGSSGYHHCGDYDIRAEFPNGVESIAQMLQKIKAAGIIPGLHFLHSHIGISSRYVTPVADHRLNLTRRFTLSKPLGNAEDTVYVEQNPEGAPVDGSYCVLKFDGELISYSSYSTEYPYCFKGCVRGHFDTRVTSHAAGCIGGVLDVSEFGATSVYIDQETSLQDEVAEKLAKVYNAGFEFIYFDGSEGTNPPFEFHVPNAQYKVYQKLKKEPLYCEGAAKAHFSWHMLSGGNAFDAFPTEEFKAMIARFPLEEASRMANDFTRLNFGWWELRTDTRPDIYEYGSSRAAAWDCPVTMIADIDAIKKNARIDDVFEVIRRWEDVRRNNLLTRKQKEELKNPNQEHILLKDENGEYELLAYNHLKNAANGDKRICVFIFERKGKNCVVCWHNKGNGFLKLPHVSGNIEYFDEIGGSKVDFESDDSSVTLPLGKRRYLITGLTKEKLTEAFENAVLISD